MSYTLKNAQIGDTVSSLFADGCATLTVRFNDKAETKNLMEAFNSITCVGFWRDAKSNADCPAFIRKSLGLQYEHKEAQEPEYMRVIDWARRGQQQEALEGRR